MSEANLADDPAKDPITIIGAGIIGQCTALSLINRGTQVRLIDHGMPGEGASSGNAGVISPWSVVPHSLPGVWKRIPGWLLDPEGPIYLPLNYLPKFLPWGLRYLYSGRERSVRKISSAMAQLTDRCIDQYSRHLEGTGHHIVLKESHYVHVYRKAGQAKLSGLSYELRRNRGADMEVIDAAELRRIEPALSWDYREALLIKGQARASDPGQLGQALLSKIRNQGGEVRRASVIALHRDGDTWKIMTDGPTLSSKNIVVAAGAWSDRLLRPLGLKIPLEAERGYHVNFRSPGLELNNSVMDVEQKFVSSTMDPGLRSAGTAEFSGLDAEPTKARAEVLIRQSKRLLPDLNTQEVEDWSGYRPSLPDSLPILDQVDTYPGLFAAFGHSHYGLSMGPKSGELIADLILGRENTADYSPYRISRFQGVNVQG